MGRRRHKVKEAEKKHIALKRKKKLMKKLRKAARLAQKPTNSPKPVAVSAPETPISNDNSNEGSNSSAE